MNKDLSELRERAVHRYRVSSIGSTDALDALAKVDQVEALLILAQKVDKLGDAGLAIASAVDSCADAYRSRGFLSVLRYFWYRSWQED